MTTATMCPTCGGTPGGSCVCLKEEQAARVVELWRANTTIGDIAEATGLDSSTEATGLDSSTVYRHVVLSGEMKRSLRIG